MTEILSHGGGQWPSDECVQNAKRSISMERSHDGEQGS
ncbi:hypothetical protein A2U01_0058431, partial [Trifolium medium]|nr:hypothetical protein [Trifolium medium]